MIRDFLTSLFSWYTMVPAAILCFAPMKNQWRKDRRTLIIRTAMLLTPILIISAFLEAYFSLGYNTLLPVLSIIAFIYYHCSLTVPIYKSLSVFILIAAFMSFYSNVANGFDAWLHPTSGLDEFSLAASLFQAALTTVMSVLMLYPAEKFGGRLMDDFDIPRVYYASIPVWGIFLTFNLLISPRKYETLYVNLMQLVFWGILSLFFVLLCLLCVWFYYIVSDMLHKAETEERNRILEMQESSYYAQQRYINETAKARHDFKHTIATLDTLVSEGDLAAVRAYLDDYLSMQPINDTVRFCENTAVNALLNFYLSMAKNAGIPLEWEISMPSNLPVSDIDLCGVLGNILENAIHACEKVPEEARFIDLAIRSKEDSRLYLVVSNSFDGNLRMNGKNYLSTDKHGSGLGLKSIRETAEKYGGTARFSHDASEFHTDVMM